MFIFHSPFCVVNNQHRKGEEYRERSKLGEGGKFLRYAGDDERLADVPRGRVGGEERDGRIQPAGDPGEDEVKGVPGEGNQEKPDR